MFILRKLVQYSTGSGRIFRGVYFLAIGMYLANKSINIKTGIIFMVLGYGGSIACFRSIFLRGFSSIVCIIGIFIILENIKLPDSIYYLIMRKISMGIYFIHLYIWTIYYRIFYGKKTYGMDCFIVTLMASIVISSIYIYWSGKKKTNIINPLTKLERLTDAESGEQSTKKENSTYNKCRSGKLHCI